ncbi:MAG: DMT family transporter [Patescibacteria group bacterium]
MNEVLVSTVGGLLAFVFWGMSDWLVSKNSKKYNAYEVNLATKIAGLVTSILLLAFNYQNIESFSQLIPFIAVGLLFAVAFVLMIKALTDGSVGVIVPVISTNPLFTLALAIILGGSVLSGNQIMSILVIISGVLALTYQKNTSKIPLKELHKDTIYALLAAAIWGLAFYIVNQNVADVPWQIVYGTVGLSSFIFSLLLVFIKLRKTFRSVVVKTGANKIGLRTNLDCSSNLLF